jgi:AraC-like DNA-binding protein
MRRRPIGPLEPFVETVWISDAPGAGPGAIERVLPTGAMHVVLRLAPEPLVLIEDGSRRAVGRSVLGGARTRFYVRDVSMRSLSVGAQLRPGASMALFGVPADVLAEQHTCLEDLWGAETERLRDRIASSSSASDALARFEAFLSARAISATPTHPAVVHALARLRRDPHTRIGALAETSGYSHRAFIALFRAAVGLAPASYRRVLRVDRALEMLATPAPLVHVAAAAGFADQAHFTREIALVAGTTPGVLRASGASLHVPIAPGQIRSRRVRESATT